VRNYYRVLGVHRKSTLEELKVARRKAAERYHPDKQGGHVDRMVEANEAYRTLTDKSLRRAYDVVVGAQPLCPKCKGEGVTKKQRGFTAKITTICSTCHGAGHILTEEG